MKERLPKLTFEDIANQYREEMADPALEPLLQRVREYSQQIDGMSISTRDARKIKDELNQLLNTVGGNREDIAVRVSGKARLLNEGDVAQLQAPVLPPHLHGFRLESNQIDADGVYYPLHRQLLVLDSISVDPIGTLTKGSAPHRISFHMSARANDYDELADYEYYMENASVKDKATSEDEEKSLNIVAYACDIDTVELHMSSLERVERDLRRDFPEIASQIDQFSSAGDDTARIHVAANLNLLFNWAGTRYGTPEERQEFLDTVGRLINEKLHLDSSLYIITHKGLVYATRHDASRIAHVDSEPRTTSGIIVGCTLESGDDELNLNSAQIELEIMLVISAPANGFGRGDYLLTIPTSSVLSAINTRNESFFFDALQEVPARLESQDREDVAVSATEGEDDETTTSMPNLETKRYSYNQLRECQEAFTTLWSYIREAYVSRTFFSLESATEARDGVLGIIAEFADHYNAALHAQVAISGECLEYIDAKDAVAIYSEDKRVIIDMDELEVRQGDPILERRGQFCGDVECTIVPGKENDGTESYVISPYLFFYDNDAAEQSFEHGSPDDMYSTPLFQLSSRTKFAVALGQEGTLSFSELSQSDEIFETLQAIEEVMPGSDELLDHLTTVSDILATEQDDQFVDIDPSMLQTVAALLQTNEAVGPLALKALEAILKNHKLILGGAIYDAKGEYAMSVNTEGTSLQLGDTYGHFITILDETPGKEEAGPAIVVSNIQTSALHYVPIAMLERVRV